MCTAQAVGSALYWNCYNRLGKPVFHDERVCMSEIITLELSKTLAESARAVAARTHRRIEDILIEWLDQAATEVPVELLPDEQVLALRDLEMDNTQQADLGDLLARQREGQLTTDERERLDTLINIYRRGMVRKAQ